MLLALLSSALSGAPCSIDTKRTLVGFDDRMPQAPPYVGDAGLLTNGVLCAPDTPIIFAELALARHQ